MLSDATESQGERLADGARQASGARLGQRMKLTPEARAELERREKRVGKRRVKKAPRTAVLVEALKRSSVTRGTSRLLSTLKAPK